LPIGPYFADFACREERLVIELDGSQHAENEYDRRRDAYMVDQGWSVMRFWNVDALKEQDAVVDTIIAALEYRLEETLASDLRFIPCREYRERFLAAVAPHPYPLPVKDGERGSPELAPYPHPPFGHLLPVNGEKE